MVGAYGSDALRMALITNSSPGNDQRMSAQRIEQAGHFANKLWNATRFVVSQGKESGIGNRESVSQNSDSRLPTPDSRFLADSWILSRYARTVQTVTQMLDDYQLGEAGKVLQEFVWSDYCDWYIEASKTALRSDDAETREATLATARYVLNGTLRLLHPYMPFLTEELWQHLNGWPSRNDTLPKPEQSIIVAPWPDAPATDDAAERDFELLQNIITEIRNARAEAVRDAPENIKKEMVGRRIEALIAGGSHTAILRQEADTLALLARLDPARLTIEENLPTGKRPDKATTLVIEDTEVVLPLAGLVDLDSERKRLQSEAEMAQAEITRIEKLLSNQEFVSKAKPEVVQREREKLSGAQERLAKLTERLAAL
jgi:valyl-tRNA synthetase